MKKKIQKPFDVEAAKNGAVVETVNGNSVRILCYDRAECGDGYPIIALINVGGMESCHSYTSEGKLLRNSFDRHDLVIIEEAEALLPARGSRRSSDVDSTIVPTFLSEMDGFEENSTFIILATNHPNQLDAAVIRPGRIDLKIEINRPNKEDAVDIFNLYLRKTKCSKKPCNLAELAADYLFNINKSVNISGALIKNIVDAACLSAVRRAAQGSNIGVTEDDIKKSIDLL